MSQSKPVEQQGPPLSPYRAHGDVVYVSGQIGMGADGVVPDDFEAQMRLAMDELRATLESAGASLDTVLKATVFITRSEDYALMNRIYAESFPGTPPARSTLVTALALPELRFEIEAIAHHAG